MADANNGGIDSASPSPVFAPAQCLAERGGASAPISGEPSSQTSVHFPRATENQVETKPAPPNRTAIYVSEFLPATLRFSDTMVIYPTLREARDAWLALSADAKKDASITINKPDGARYDGLMIYRLWLS